MSVPLDRLYNFLHDVCNHRDLIIYGFFPHGSRKLEDLIALNWKDQDWFTRMTNTYMIFHDQELLIYDLYSAEDFKHLTDHRFAHHSSEELKMLIASMHLRSCVVAPIGVYDQVLLCHSEKNSQELDLYQQNGFIGVYYWSHAVIARDWFRFAQRDPMLKPNFDHIVYDFLIYNRAWSGRREYRLTFAEMLANKNLISCCRTSFSEIDNGLHYTQHTFANADLAISRNDLHTLYPVNLSDASSSADYNNKDYAVSAIEVVMETLFDDSRHHLTEKILRPIACGRPFILVATQGSLEYLKQYGFETFDGLINETYDSISDPRQRLEAIVQELERISGMNLDEKKSLWTQLYAISERNQKLFFSDEWQDSIIKEFKDNFDSALTQLTATAKYEKELDRIALTDTALRQKRSCDDPSGDPTIETRDRLKIWVQQNSKHSAIS
jgi:hypothetical protein